MLFLCLGTLDGITFSILLCEGCAYTVTDFHRRRRGCSICVLVRHARRREGVLCPCDSEPGQGCHWRRFEDDGVFRTVG